MSGVAPGSLLDAAARILRAIAIQADMWDSSGPTLSGFDAYKQRLAARARGWREPVLLLNGDSHVYAAGRPLAGA